MPGVHGCIVTVADRILASRELPIVEVQSGTGAVYELYSQSYTIAVLLLCVRRSLSLPTHLLGLTFHSASCDCHPLEHFHVSV